MEWQKLSLAFILIVCMHSAGAAVEIPHPRGCDIKGNVGRHYSFYYLTDHPKYQNVEINKLGERWFCTEDEALAAGWMSAGSLEGRVGKKKAINSCLISPEAPNRNCAIKGNINSKGDDIYHVPCSRYYAVTEVRENDGERWFCSTAEAIASGWRAPLN